MTSSPQGSLREVPLTEIIPHGSSSPLARHSSSVSSDYEHSLLASVITLPLRQRRSRSTWLIDIVTLLAIIGAGTWYW